MKITEQTPLAFFLFLFEHKTLCKKLDHLFQKYNLSTSIFAVHQVQKGWDTIFTTLGLNSAQAFLI